ncbi:type II toxin-antitoxin system VapB family antitoxin [Streptomyces endophytica]|uniref:Type II toxin-antitoxin system VapB family antitoxin n=1 Tax=Streptomyces endophytica TaxID=2991496 RepID=A0ABY6PDN3_9ACTN|nr:type II toxin-antitoxin system VapB family antitoxin [Streptomyces endophytica]UZJ31963.1 type II toxin-antitoxin system VapB family antitoxin [Streptomyces endophytica]
MTKMLIDIDEEALAAAQEAFGTHTKKDTVNTALTEGVARIRRAQALAESRRLAQDGAIDLDLLMDKRHYRPRPGQ